MSIINRLLIFIIFLVGIYFLPWWILFAGVFVLMLVKRVVMFELLIPAFVIDTVYGVPTDRFNNFQFVSTVIMACILLLIFFIKKYIRA